MKWFKHDSDANMDGRLQEILLDYGLEGYGLYFYCLELIVNKIDVDNLNFELEHDSRIIARNTGSTPQKVTEMMKRFIELGLFQNSDGRITCLKLLQRLDKSMTSNVKMRSLIDQAKSNHDTVMTKSCLSHDKVMSYPDLVMQEENTLDNITLKKKVTGRFTPPSLEEVISYCRERNNTVEANNFLNHYEANGWMRGKNKIKDWKACVRTWEAKDNNNQSAQKPTQQKREMPKAGTEE